MKINRNGQEFELTQGELVAAYLEQASIYDQDNIRGNMEGYLSPDVYARLKDNKAFIENAASKLRESQDDSMGYDEALASAIKAAEKEFRIPVNRVTILRERYSEHQIWPDDYWVDCNRTPSKELFQAAVEAYLMTSDGQKDVEWTQKDFNWGDAVMYVPDEVWNQFGIYPFSYETSPAELGLEPISSENFVQILVDQDEVLIPDDYFDRLETMEESTEVSSCSLKAVDIDWDVDSEDERDLLPSEIEIPEEMVDEEDISDYLSDVTGFCHKGFRLVNYSKEAARDMGSEPAKLSLFDQIQSASIRVDSLPDFVVASEVNILGQNLYFGNIKVFLGEDQNLLCKLPDESAPRNLRISIRDVREGDAFLFGEAGTIRTTSDNAYQNHDEPDEPWFVYGDDGEVYFEEDISPIFGSKVKDFLIGLSQKLIEKPTLDEQVRSASARAGVVHPLSDTPVKNQDPER